MLWKNTTREMDGYIGIYRLLHSLNLLALGLTVGSSHRPLWLTGLSWDWPSLNGLWVEVTDWIRLFSEATDCQQAHQFQRVPYEHMCIYIIWPFVTAKLQRYILYISQSPLLITFTGNILHKFFIFTMLHLADYDDTYIRITIIMIINWVWWQIFISMI